jgi:hypothetical protein
MVHELGEHRFGQDSRLIFPHSSPLAQRTPEYQFQPKDFPTEKSSDGH